MIDVEIQTWTENAVREIIQRRMRSRGRHPRCRACRLDCKIPNVPGLVLICRQTPGFVAEERRRLNA